MDALGHAVQIPSMRTPSGHCDTPLSALHNGPDASHLEHHAPEGMPLLARRAPRWAVGARDTPLAATLAADAPRRARTALSLTACTAVCPVCTLRSSGASCMQRTCLRSGTSLSFT